MYSAVPQLLSIHFVSISGTTDYATINIFICLYLLMCLFLWDRFPGEGLLSWRTCLFLILIDIDKSFLPTVRNVKTFCVTFTENGICT